MEKKPDEIPAAVQTFLGAVASIVIPEEVNEETGPVLNEQIGAAQNAYDALSEEELAREDVQAAVEKLTAAIKALNGGPKTLEETAVAKIGETEYMTLDEAVTAAADGGTIELLADCAATKTFYKSLTFTGGYTVSMNTYGWRYSGNLVFDGAGLIINSDETSSVANNGEAGRWFTMVLGGSITARNGANITFTFDSASGTNCAIYAGAGGVTINVEAGSRFSIFGKNTAGVSGQGIQLDSTANTGIYVKNGSHFLIDGTNRGYVNSPTIYVEEATFTVQNCTSNGSNGGTFTAIDAKINFLNNAGHGLSATTLDISKKSEVKCNNNGYYGVTVGSSITMDGTSQLTSNENGGGFTGGALRLQTANSTGKFAAGAQVELKRNVRNALENYGTCTFEDGVILSITDNTEPINGAGIYNAGVLTLPANAVVMNNTAQKFGGGIYNIGESAIIPGSVQLYNNHAGTAGDDIYNKGAISFGNVGTDWALDGEPDCNGAIHAIDGWYEDGEGSRWLADTADTSKQHVVLMNAGTHTASDDGKAVALKAAHGLIPVEPVDPVPGPDWVVSRSKTATNLDANFESRVTLSLPSAEEQLVTDIVFVLDKSTSPTLEQQTLDMLQTLKAQIENTNARVKVGVVIFNKVANMTNFMDLATQYDAIEAAIRQEISSGTNAHAGLLAGIGMLDNDSSVDDSRKYLIFVSDGITYIYNQTPTATAWSFLNDGVVSNWDGPDNWKSKYGSNDPPADWAEFLGRVKTQAEVQGTTYEYPYGGTPTASTPVENQSGYVNSVDKALCLTYEAYSAAAAKYHCYAMAAGTKSGEQYLWGPSFMRFLADGRTVDFSQIQNDILYLVDRGSWVEDYMGYVADDYDFDFVKPEDMILKVGSESYAAVKLSENEYGFKPVNGGYAFTVEYLRGNGQEEEHFVWNINEAISNFAPVQLTYTVQLTNPREEPGTYGEYDRDGSTDSTELYTNNSAVLYPVDSNGQEGEALPFPKPTVSYTVEPKKLEVKVTKVWDDFNDNDGFRPDSVTVTLLADGEPTGKTLVLSEANQWTGSFTELEAYADGEEIVYTVTENKVNKYTTVITNAQDSATDFIITNSHVPEMMSIPVVKRWNDNNDANDRRPGSITVYLYANGEATGEKLRITARNGWVGEFENLPVYANGKAITYSVREKSMYFYSGAVSTNPNGGFIITNTYTTSPGTGDSSNIGLWAAMAGMSLAAAVVVLFTLKKRKAE